MSTLWFANDHIEFARLHRVNICCNYDIGCHRNSSGVKMLSRATFPILQHLISMDAFFFFVASSKRKCVSSDRTDNLSGLCYSLIGCILVNHEKWMLLKFVSTQKKCCSNVTKTGSNCERCISELREDKLTERTQGTERNEGEESIKRKMERLGEKEEMGRVEEKWESRLSMDAGGLSRL